jgi:hypothetical protein
MVPSNKREAEYCTVGTKGGALAIADPKKSMGVYTGSAKMPFCRPECPLAFTAAA